MSARFQSYMHLGAVYQKKIVLIKTYPDKNILLKSVFAFIFLFFLVNTNFAQVTDTINSQSLKTANAYVKVDSLGSVISVPKAKPVEHSPKKSALMSTILPGLGQVYNKKYWKVPIIYAGLIGLGYSINFNHTKYITYREAYKDRIDGDPFTIDNYPKYSDDNLNTLQAYYHRFRNLSFIGATLVYVMNIVDASVDAHMFTFDVSDDLSFHISPTLINTAGINNYTTGLSLNIKF